MFSKKWLAIIAAGALTPVILAGCKQDTSNMSPEQIVAHAYANSIKDDLRYMEATMELLPPNAKNIKLVGNGWITFTWNDQCFLLSDQGHNVIKSAGMITNMDMQACLSHKDLRQGPTIVADEGQQDGSASY